MIILIDGHGLQDSLLVKIFYTSLEFVNNNFFIFSSTCIENFNNLILYIHGNIDSQTQ